MKVLIKEIGRTVRHAIARTDRTVHLGILMIVVIVGIYLSH